MTTNLLTLAQAAQIAQITRQHMYKLMLINKGPPACAVSRMKPMFNKNDVLDWAIARIDKEKELSSAEVTRRRNMRRNIAMKATPIKNETEKEKLRRYLLINGTYKHYNETTERLYNRIVRFNMKADMDCIEEHLKHLMM